MSSVEKKEKEEQMMTTKNSIFGRRKRRQRLEEERHIKMSGIGINGNPAYVDTNKLPFILTNAVINFLVVIGTAGCFLNAFDIEYDLLIILVSGAMIALTTAFLYYNNIIKTLGYLLAFGGFVFGIYNLQYIIKGGFGYISNKMMEFLEKEFFLPIERSYDVYGYGERMSVTICMIFIMFATMLLLNMAISESKGYALVFIFTFPIVQMGMYFDLKMNIFFFAMYMAGLLGVYFLRSSSHYHIESKKKKGYFKKKKKNTVVFDYVNDGKYSLSFIVILMIVIGIFSTLIGLAYPQNHFEMSTRYDELKSNTREFTRRLAMVGFWGMFNPSGSAGGVGRSRMGQSKYVQLDYETDLIVRTFVEQGENSIYLKSFNGTFYKDAYWEIISEHGNNHVSLEDYDLNASELNVLTERLGEYYDSSFIGGEKQIEVINMGATSTYFYIPYYATPQIRRMVLSQNDDEYLGSGLPRGYMHKIEYTPLKKLESIDAFRQSMKEENEREYEQAQINQLEDELRYLDMEKRYSEYVHEMYMEVPKENQESIRSFCEKYNLSSDSDNIAERIAEIFQEDYEYTLMPGTTPSGEEFVNYFLDEQKKGYCMYFATAATLIFRELGIPARFAGGYVLFTSDFVGGTNIAVNDENGENLSEWVDEDYYNPFRYPRGLSEFEVDDSMAHAWVEIYIDGFGWIPVETTPSDDDEEELQAYSNENIMRFLADNVFTSENLNNVRDASIGLFFTILIAAAIMLIMYLILGIIIRVVRRNNKSVIKLYEYLCKCTVFRGVRKIPAMSYAEYAELIIENDIMNEESIHLVTRILEKDKFSGGHADEKEVLYVSDRIKATSDEIYKNLKWYQKFIYRYIKWL